jgi:hypothetical protein
MSASKWRPLNREGSLMAGLGDWSPYRMALLYQITSHSCNRTLSRAQVLASISSMSRLIRRPPRPRSCAIPPCRTIDYGLSEERIGRYIAHRRSEYYLASKCGCVVGADPAPRGQRNRHVYTRDKIRAGVEQSLLCRRRSTMRLSVA